MEKKSIAGGKQKFHKNGVTYPWTTVKEKIQKKLEKYLETNEIENTTYHNLQNAAEVVLAGKFIVKNSFKRKKKLQIKPHKAKKRKRTNQDQI